MAEYNSRLTVADLRLYVPLFQAGEQAEDKLANGIEDLSLSECAKLISEVGLKKIAHDEISKASYALVASEIKKIISKSHLRSEEDEIFPVIYYAGLDGMTKGLRKFDVNKIEASATNYLFQWIMVYAKKELLGIEAPMGVPISRFQRSKKIAAVRKKLNDELGREVTNEELLDYFHSGKAEYKNMNGPKVKKEGVSDANKKITIAMLEEQQKIEKNLTFAQMFDVLEDHRANSMLATFDNRGFNETLIGAFLSECQIFNETAIAVLKSELNADLTENERAILDTMTARTVSSLLQVWRAYLIDPNEKFVKFLRSNLNSAGTEDFDVSKLLGLIAAKEVKRNFNYDKLFLLN